MGVLDTLFGRTRPVRPNLDALFAVPAAATTLAAGLQFAATGAGAVCFRAAEGAAAARAVADAVELLRTDDAAATTVTTDRYGYTWVVHRRPDTDLAALVTDLHAVTTTLTDAGFGPSLLCTVIAFRGAADPYRPLALVYLFKRGTFYPFAPTGPQTRDNQLELAVRAQLRGELPVEPDLTRWFPVWGVPVFDR